MTFSEMLPHTFKFGDAYPKSTQVLLWIGTACATIISATWVLIQAHNHEEYIRQREFERVITLQESTNAQINAINNRLIAQTEIINNIQGKMEWLAPPAASSTR